MTQLTRVELRRILSRKIVHLSVLAILAVSALVFWGLWQSVQPLSAFEDRARADFEMAHEDWESQQEFNDEEFISQCLEDQEAERERTGDATLDFGCEWPEPTFEEMLASYGPPSMVDLYTMNLQQTGTLVFFLVLLGGSTATAAELAHRTLGTWLTFEPRRDRVFGSKVLASGLVAIPITALFLALILGGIPLIFRMRGVDDAVTAAQWADLGWMSARIVLLAVFLGMVGAAAGLLLRHTGAVLGIVIGYMLVAENMVRALFPDWAKYLLSENLIAWVNDGHEMHTWVCDEGFEGNCREVITRISLEQGALVIGVVGAVIILASWLVFRRRDVN
ncbi:ABC transporter permease [Ornithinimicrobium ciconiae]|uniref:ABC transporter permease n=1 Tax=Ornithinimicrobium ciconiae TaxID=2594265 RepID=A0A516GA09_9MICO|nr:ABC transporter permease [Ornithinimicrobium ciconiae]QDO88364.1 ABC transporter permease [Ornithinimicrobium ciconiae]